MRNARSDRDNEAGAVLVEFLIVLPVLLALVFGMITAGLTYNNKLSITNGAREGARFAATLPASTGSWFADVAAAAEGAATGDFDSTNVDHTVCVARTIDGAAWEGNGGSECFSDGRNDPRVQVRLERPGDINAIFYNFNFTITGDAVAVWEAADA